MSEEQKNVWLDRTLTLCAYSYSLALSEKEFWKELHRMEVPCYEWPKFILHDHSDATLHYFNLKNGNRAAIVCLDMQKAASKTGVQIAALLVHEAVHIWQRHAAAIGSFNDHGDEEEAYAIQAIAQNLMESFVERTITPQRKEG